MNSNKVWGGGEKWHYETASHLSNAGYNVLIISNWNSQLQKKVAVHPGIKLFACKITNYSFLNLIKVLRLRKILIQNNVQSIVLGLSNDVKAGGIAAKLAGVEKIIYRRGSAIPVKNTMLNRYLFRKVLTNVVSNSEEIKKTIFFYNKELINEDKVQVIYNGIRLDAWPVKEKHLHNPKGKEPIVLGNAGRLVEQKGQEYLIRMALELKKKAVPFKMLIAGTGVLEDKLKNLVRQYGMEEEVVFLDFVNDVSKFLEGIDIYCSTSLHEGSSHVILEAMASEKPVIAFEISSMPEMVSDGQNGYLIPFGNIERYAERIMELDKDRKKLYNMGRNSRKQVEERFNFSKQVGQFLELIEGGRQ